MGEFTSIEWCHHTFNGWRGCSKCSAGCKNCFADDLSGRNPAVLGIWGPNGTRPVAVDAYWRRPLAWDRKAAAAGERHRVFASSLSDVFEGPESMPASAVHEVRRARLRLVALIHNTPNLDWLLLTKRPHNVRPLLEDLRDATDLDMMGRTRDQLRAWLADGPPANVRIGTSVEDQASADERLPHLVRLGWPNFVSAEPLLGPVDLSPWLDVIQFEEGGAWGRRNIGHLWDMLDWVIVGGESGSKARPMNVAWVRSIRDQCAAAGVPLLLKQWGEWLPGGQVNVDGNQVGGITWHDFGDGNFTLRVGKKRAGRNLDGVIHDGFPAGSEVARG